MALLFTVFFIFSKKVYADDCSAILLSEIQITGGTGKSNEDFIELLNAGEQKCNLKGYRLIKRTASGTSDTLIKAWENDTFVFPLGYYLWANSDNGYASKIEADAWTSQTISNDNGVALRHGENNFGDIIDALGWGMSKNIYSQRYLFTKNPEASQSIERKIDGTFFLQNNPNPQNSKNIPKKENEDPPAVDEKYLCEGVSLNEVYPFGDDEYVEIKNNEDHTCNLSDWKIKDKAGHKIIFPIKEIERERFFVLKGGLYLNDDKDEIRLLDSSDKEIDKREYEVDFHSQEKSYSYFEEGWQWTTLRTPGNENEKIKEDEDVEEEIGGVLRVDNPSKYAGKILINEFLPIPLKGEDEFIELYNAGEKQEDIFGWALHDATKSGEYIFKEHTVLEDGKFILITGHIFKFALNSGKETLTLRDSEGKIVSQIYYDKAKSGASYNWNGAKWRWSKFLTPGRENMFNNEPYGKLKLPDDVWEKVYADFSISTGDADGDKIKVTWDFGDGHKSYLAKTRHKYNKKGKYDASVKFSDGSEDVVKIFTVKVEEFPHPKVSLVAVSANPEGNDSENETITVENKSKKKVNLLGWSIATGSSSKKLINHPIREEFEIGKNKAKEITSKVSSFTLNNKKGKIELRYPDGEVASKVKYNNEKGIEEGEIYFRNKNGWEWVKENTNDKLKITNENESLVIGSLVTEMKAESSVIGNQSSDAESEIVETIESENKFIELKNNNIDIEILKVASNDLDSDSISVINGQYLLIQPSPNQEHYAISFAKELSSDINEKLNSLLNGMK